MKTSDIGVIRICTLFGVVIADFDYSISLLTIISLPNQIKLVLNYLVYNVC
jgi:hypothetical protein